MARLSNLSPDDLSDDQQAIYNDILESRAGLIDGPFAPWLHSPVFADRAQKLGAFCRYHTSLPARLSELAILITAKQWRANVEWFIHAPIASNAGLSDEVISALKNGEEPDFQHSDEEVVYKLALELYATKRVGDKNYRNAVNELGEAGVVELVGILGYYALVAMTLNVFEIDLPDMGPLPFSE